MKAWMIIFLSLISPIILFFLWASYPWDLGAKVVDGEIEEVKNPKAFEHPTTLSILTWNMAWGHGMGSEGTAEYVKNDKAFYEHHLEMMADAIKHSGADVVLLQEIDFGSSRSHYIDQLKFLAEKTGLSYQAKAESWRTNYVPFPYWPIARQFGKISNGGAILSRFPIIKNKIHLLAKPASKAWWYNMFYLYRYFQEVTFKVESREFTLINLHLEAFDKEAKMAQVKELVKLVKNSKIDFVAGDFNMLPEGAMKRSNFSNPADNYEGDHTYKQATLMGLKEVVDPTFYLQKEESWFTFPSVKPDRRLDYIFYNEKWPLISTEVVSGAHAPASDHLPLKAIFKFFDPEFIRD
ncbi:MAG: endonuclease/exonuclease/phosphatase family protein [Bacteriovoracaceae bacterium]|nr:endonuclease/exonuclease/phosphatase family protein [Bacteriovoracaceae bacterium]